MPLIDPPANPTWVQIRAGLEAAGAERATATGERVAANNKVRIGKQESQAAAAKEQAAIQNYQAWLAKIQRLVYAPPA